MSGVSFFVVDTETSGLSTKHHEVIEINIIRALDRVSLFREIKAEFPNNASYDALKITGKTMADLKNGVAKEEAVAIIEKFFSDDGSTPNGRCIVAHNAPFDRRFLHALWDKVNDTGFPANLWLDTMALTDKWLKTTDQSNIKLIKTATGKVSKKLPDICDMIGIKKYAHAHSAQSDSRNTYMLWKKLIDEHKVDYLPFIKSFPHKEETIDISNLNPSDIEEEAETTEDE